MPNLSATSPSAGCARVAMVLGLLLTLSACGLAPREAARQDLAQARPFDPNAGYNGSGD